MIYEVQLPSTQLVLKCLNFSLLTLNFGKDNPQPNILHRDILLCVGKVQGVSKQRLIAFKVLLLQFENLQ